MDQMAEILAEVRLKVRNAGPQAEWPDGKMVIQQKYKIGNKNQAKYTHQIRN